MSSTYSTQTPQEEWYNFLTHALGAVLSGIGLIILLFSVSEYTWVHYTSVSIYGVSMIVLFSASSLYHYATDETLKRSFHKFDHISIYYLIAGTYTPISLILLEERNGWLLFSIVWSIALLGTFYKLFFTGRWKKLSLFIYLSMGWLIVFKIHHLYELADFTTLLYFGLGGLFYTVGAFFYAKHKIPYNHVIWHIFVLLGAFCHYMMVYQVV